jgi:hypothetical protein
MTAYVFFTQGNAAFADPLQGPNGDVQWYRLMNGTTAPAGVPFVDPNTNQTVKFCLAGDPVTGTGWIDGQGGLAAADRRICLVTGPFTMAVGDTQELVVASLAGVGGDRLSSITLMRAVDDKAQAAYNNLFSIPGPPPAPIVARAELDGKIILSWGDPVTIEKTEGTVDQGFTFEGYNVYEYPPPAVGGDPILLGTFDLNNGIKVIADTVYDASTGLNMPTVLQRGTDNGVVRTITLTASKVTGSPLINGSTYYFGVTAFSYNGNPPAAAGTHSLESPPSGVSFPVVPHSLNPGTRYGGAAGDTLKPVVTVAAGGTATDGSALAFIVDPTKLTGHRYAVTFQNGVDGTVWTLTDLTTSKAVLTNQTNQTGDGDYGIVDGILFKVIGPVPGMKRWDVTGTRRFSPVGGAAFGLEGFVGTGGLVANDAYDPSTGTIGMAGNLAFGGIGTTLGTADYHSVVLKLATADFANLWDPKATPSDANFSRAYRVLRSATAAAAQPSFEPWIVNKTAGYPYQGYDYSVPFSAWDVDVTPPVRLAVGCFENNVAAGAVDGRYWPGLTSVDNSTTREFAFIYKAPYTDTPDPALAVNLSNNASTPLMWVITCARRADAVWATGDEFKITANHVNTPAITYTFTAPANKVDADLAKQDVALINVFPNPYLGFNPQEINRYARFVTFNHLPQKATIRIFNLAGILVRTILKDDATQFAQWDLNNEGAFPVSAGMYVAYIDMPDLGSTKILKLGVIPEQQYLDRW